jgi:hypothetical protein
LVSRIHIQFLILRKRFEQAQKRRNRHLVFIVSVTVALGDWAFADEPPSVITPAKMPHIGEVDG